MVVVYPRNLPVMFDQNGVYNSLDIVVVDVADVAVVLVLVHVVAFDLRTLRLKFGQNQTRNS